MTDELNKSPPAHTPGPWHNRGRYSHDNSNLHIVSHEGELLAFVGHINPTTENANARLIANAPDLLEASETVVRCWESGDLAGAVRWLDLVCQKVRANTGVLNEEA